MTNQSPATARDRLLLIDSEQMICELLQYKFETEGFEVDIMTDGHEALEANLDPYVMILVDLMDKPFTGLDFTRALKRNQDTFSIPVVIMSKTKDVDDVVNALDAGADDYIAKPFSARELVARVKSILRRRRISFGRRLSNTVSYRDLTVDIGTGAVTIAGESVQLSRTEFLILAMLLRHRGEFFDRTRIQQEAWGDTEVSDRAVDTNISRLRKKIGVYGRNIVNRHSYGYGFVD